MADSLLATKFYVPHLRAEHLLRPGLTRRLDEALARKLTLVCAPAGYGKTTLLAEWLAGRPPGRAGRDANICFAWLSLDAADSDPARFFAYLLAALRQIDPAIGRNAEFVSHTVPPPPHDALLTSLINDLVTIPSFLLVLDDYHLITSLAVHLQMAFLVDHQPPNMHVVIATREDPPLPLAAWRAKGQVAEIRQGDLQFTAEETAEFLQRVGQTRLAAAEIAAVQQRTEGWAAGLELLAHSLRDCDDVTGLVKSFAGSNRYVLDYLMEEVFGRQSPDIQHFLLQTSVLDRLCGPLCDAVTGRDDGRAVLSALEQRNLFVIPLDRSRQWYRYHHLFSGLLRHRLELDAPGDVPGLHLRAGHWCSGNGFPVEAIRHALAAGGWEDAAALISRHGDDLVKRGEIITLLGWYRALPDPVLRSRPQLCAGYAWPLILSGEVDEAEAYLALAEAEAQPETASGREFAGAIAAGRAYIARFKGDGRRAIEQSERALALLPPGAWQARSIVALNLGLIYWYTGYLDAAEQALGEAQETCRRSGNEYAALVARVFLCGVYAARGHLERASAECRQVIQQGGQMPCVALAHANLGKLLYDRNELAAAAAHAKQAIAISRASGQAEFEITAVRTLALIEQARGNETAAQEALTEMDRLARDPLLSPMALRHALAYRILVALRAGYLAEARRLADRGPALNEVHSMPDYMYLSLAHARLLLAENRRVEALTLLESRDALLSRAGFTAARIDTRGLQALAAASAEEGRAYLAEALSLAGREGYVRPFVDLGEPMADMLKGMAGHGIAVEFIGRLLAAFKMARRGGSEDAARIQPLIEPLTERELDVLRLLASGHTNDEIGRSLYVSANTVKAHLKNIYRKLDVDSRRAAAAKAKDLGLL